MTRPDLIKLDGLPRNSKGIQITLQDDGQWVAHVLWLNTDQSISTMKYWWRTDDQQWWTDHVHNKS